MKEELLHHIWLTKRFDLSNLRTVDGLDLCIYDFGHLNYNAGPDILDCRLTLEEVKWAGHIEIHIRSSDWSRHDHQSDPAYNSVILHVVYEDDKTIVNQNGQTIPTLELKDRIDQKYITNHVDLMASLTWIPCQAQLITADYSNQGFYLEKLLVERLINKIDQIEILLGRIKNNWEEALYFLLMKYLGLKVNNVAFERLAEVVPHALLIKCETLFQKEALLLGQAGLLHGNDEYISRLEKEYEHLKSKFDLSPMTGVEWRFSKLRPANFPTIRIAQLADLYHNTPQLFQTIRSQPNTKNLQELLTATTSDYWHDHYLPGKPSTPKVKQIGLATKQILIINAIVPLLYTYARKCADDNLQEQTLDILSELPAEDNKIIRKWKELGLVPESAAHSQALIHLKNELCDTQRCLECNIGRQIIFGS